MVIYEVNLAVDNDIYNEFQIWLNEHATEMLQFSGFLKASIMKQEADLSDQIKLTIQYQLENREALEEYFTEHANQMRDKGIDLFKDKCSAERRIYDIQSIILK